MTIDDVSPDLLDLMVKINAPLFAAKDDINVRAAASTQADIFATVAKGKQVGNVLAYAKQSDGVWFMVSSTSSLYDFGFVRFDVVNTSDDVASQNPSSSTILKGLAIKDQVIFTNMLSIANNLTILHNAGIDVTDLRARFDATNQSYTDRQQWIKDNFPGSKQGGFWTPFASFAKIFGKF